MCFNPGRMARMDVPFVHGEVWISWNLSAGDIVNQVISIPFAGKITHIVLMGMGEPLDNLRMFLKASNIITAEWGMASVRATITVSTVGIPHAVEDS